MARIAGAGQGWSLIACTWLAVAAAAVIAPVAPRLAVQFPSVPNAADMVQIAIGLPSLFVAVLAGPFGGLSDRLGRRVILLGALVLYGACGMAPFWLASLPQILLSRLGVGVAEAAVLATSTALIGDYFQHDRREKWFAIQGGSATLVAVLLITISGTLSQVGWRLPFLIYGLPLVLALVVGRVIWEPAHVARDKHPLAWGGLLGIGLVTLFAALAFFIVLVQLPFLLTERGFGAAGLVTIGEVAATLTAPLGALLFRLMSGRAVAWRLAASFTASALGLAIIAASSAYVPILVGAAINGLGSGIALPSLMAWAMAGRPPNVMGRVAGAWNAFYALGQFLSPPVFIAVASLIGGTGAGMALFAAALAVAAVASLGMAARQSLGLSQRLGV